MKRFAIRGLLILSLVVVSSMFFAQTVLTITTPKIKIETARKGKFEDRLSLTGEIGFERTLEYTPIGVSGITLTINKLHFRIGDWVEKGQVIADASLPADFETKISDAREKFQTAQGEYLKNETENASLAKNTDSDKNNVIREAEAALNMLMDAQEALIAATAGKGLALGTDAAGWATTVQASGDAELITLMGNVIDAQTAVNTAEEQVVTLFSKSRTKKELFEYIEKRVSLRRNMDKEQKALLLLLEQSEQLKTIIAPRPGYIVEMGLEQGKTYDGTKAAVTVSVDCEPMLKCDASGVERTLETGMKAGIKSSLGNLQSEITAIVNSGYQKTDLFIALDKDTLVKLGGLHTLLVAKAKLETEIAYRAKQTTTLISASAVRTEGDNKSYVYTIEQGSGFWGVKLTVQKKTVTILERGEMDISLEEDLSGVNIADKEDRSIENGMTVMEYVN